MPNSIFVCDFETANNECNSEFKNTFVWLAVSYNVLTDQTSNVSFNIKDFVKYLLSQPNSTFYFHNLSFDGNFLLSYLINNGWSFKQNYKVHKSFEVIIDDLNNFYRIKLYYKYHNKLSSYTIYDSFKVIPLSEKLLAEKFSLTESKGKIDYKKYRDESYIASDEEIEYCINDTKIVAHALKYFYDNDYLSAFTIGNIAFKEFKKTLPNWRTYFPKMDLKIDTFLRNAYRGGIALVNKKFKNVNVGEGVVYDANSLYPSQMKFKPLPVGMPKYFSGEPKPNEIYNLYVVHIVCQFEIKDNMIPTLQCKHLAFVNPREFLEMSNEPTELYLTNIDFEIFKKHYHVYDLKYIDGYYFKSATGLFNDFINKFEEIKENNEGALRQIAKLILNNLYGKFATNPHRFSKLPYINSEGVLSYKLNDLEEIEPIYIADAMFITAHGRYDLINAIDNNYERFLYCDTDSIHLLGLQDAKGIAIDNKKFGCWKKESTFRKAKYLKAKCYFEEIYNEKEKCYINSVKCAGLPYDVRENISYDDFKFGAVFKGKLQQKAVIGGKVLEETTFEIKE